MTPRECPGWDARPVIFSLHFSWNSPKKRRKPRHLPFGVIPGPSSLLHYKKISHTGVLGSQQAKLSSEKRDVALKMVGSRDLISGSDLHFIDDNLKP